MKSTFDRQAIAWKECERIGECMKNTEEAIFNAEQKYEKLTSYETTKKNFDFYEKNYIIKIYWFLISST